MRKEEPKFLLWVSLWAFGAFCIHEFLCCVIDCCSFECVQYNIVCVCVCVCVCVRVCVCTLQEDVIGTLSRMWHTFNFEHSMYV